MLCAKSLAENDKQGMGGLQWFHEMKWADYPWEFCAEEYSDKLETWHSDKLPLPQLSSANAIIITV
jgi:hypothetical protein